MTRYLIDYHWEAEGSVQSKTITFFSPHPISKTKAGELLSRELQRENPAISGIKIDAIVEYILPVCSCHSWAKGAILT